MLMYTHEIKSVDIKQNCVWAKIRELHKPTCHEQVKSRCHVRRFVRFLFVKNLATNMSETHKCVHCHRTTDKTTCPSCGNECRKRKVEQLVQNVLKSVKWPSAPKVTRSNVPRQLQSLVKKCPQWEDAITALVKSNENYMHFSYGEMEQEISG